MADAATTTTAETTTTTTAAAATTTPWHQGKLDAELIGHAQNAGWKLDDPAELAASAVKAHREAQKYIGVPPDQIVKLPKDQNDEAGWNAVRQRLGMPKEAKEYDLSGVKFADGTEIEAAFADTMRGALHKAGVAKDSAPEVVRAVVNFMEEADRAEQTERTAAWERTKAALETDWGPNFARNSAIAAQGAEVFGLDQKDIEALKDHPSYPKLIKSFLKVGLMNKEPAFVDAAGRAANNGVMSREQAVARHAEMMTDGEFMKRLTNGDPKANRELEDVLRMKIGYHERAA